MANKNDNIIIMAPVKIIAQHDEGASPSVLSASLMTFLLISKRYGYRNALISFSLPLLLKNSVTAPMVNMIPPVMNSVFDKNERSIRLFLKMMAYMIINATQIIMMAITYDNIEIKNGKYFFSIIGL